MPTLPDIGSSLPEVVLRTAIVRDGRLLQRAVRKEGLELEEVRAAIRSHGLAGMEAVRLAVLETDGSIIVIPRNGDTTPSNRPPSDERTT